ncbi:uncharacterized protein LOC117780944 [Drosophila innubila]|uniref:uncharacterized protein LOC117780944 n=1 Tax=Drosophila innubila TaxID=198719 RepID=UPI00148B69F5|nr:uncharacterized protein LOC117780944 [Drosophila innubila]
MMSLLNLVQARILFAKENTNIVAATRFLRPLLRSPMAQVVISFVVGYFATIKIAQICALIRSQADKKRPELEFPAQLDADSRSCQSELPPEGEVLSLTRRQLTAFDGLHTDKPIYTALNGKIYDLSSSRQTFSQLGIFSLLAGCNANQVLNIACGSMGVCTDDVIQRWEQSLNAEFNIIGYLIDSDASDGEAESEADDDDMTVVSGIS